MSGGVLVTLWGIDRTHGDSAMLWRVTHVTAISTQILYLQQQELFPPISKERKSQTVPLCGLEPQLFLGELESPRFSVPQTLALSLIRGGRIGAF